ncbi:hypothetical protein FVF58_09455 [Paraburkholderia panacisoli]|uniref:DUF1364 family protein n=1 Tax=Paraburkholderia panacisoli TaxID=2603818 RepID=A0A5B0HE31_9BURK|nr:hypothetical protein [Paraburkholderia panacisoli]KAA1013224.1 hypothetical protein FVF58_09455 [Paraburkholderia panacisoli]
MKRSGFKPRKSTLKRSPFAQPTRQQFERGQEAKRRIGLKRKAKRPTVEEGSKYLAACRGEPCYLNVCCPWTDWADPTVVPCHSNFSKHGKAGARKADHEFSVPGCMACHAWLDTGPAPYDLKLETFDGALERWVPRRARKMGLEFKEAA